MVKDILIKNAVVYDPAAKIFGEHKDLCIHDGRFAEKVRGSHPRVIDASKMIAMPAGVDLHSHFAGGKVNTARLMRPEDSKGSEFSSGGGLHSGSGRSVPTIYPTGYLYARMGYCFANEPAVSPLFARGVHEELNRVPVLDKSALVLAANNVQALKYISEDRTDLLDFWLSYLLDASKAYGIKAVNPGGIFSWKQGEALEDLDDQIPEFGITPREIIKNLSESCSRLRLPHRLHVHLNFLGEPGNYESAIESIKIARMHVTHAQFSSYGGGSWRDFCSEAASFAAAVNRSEDVSIDLGQVVFEDTTTLTADAPFGYHLSELTGLKWSGIDIENESGGGITPYSYKMRSPVNAVQWAVGLELALCVRDPWKVSLTTDHPNGASFTYYPRVIAWLMDKKYRDKTLASCHKWASERTTLPSIERELDLSEITVLTRSSAIKNLGLPFGLSVGCEANVALYALDPEEGRGEKIEKAFSTAKYLIKNGRIISVDGNITNALPGKTFWVDTGYSIIPSEVDDAFGKYSVSSRESFVEEDYLMQGRRISV